MPAGFGLSINATKRFDDHVALGARLAPLRERGVLVVASGNVVHNLGVIDWSQPEAGFDWNRRFDDAAADVMKTSPAEAAGLADHSDYLLAAPAPDHFIPLLYVAGLAAASGETAHTLVDGYAMGALSMSSYAVGCDTLEARGGAVRAAPSIIQPALEDALGGCCSLAQRRSSAGSGWNWATRGRA